MSNRPLDSFVLPGEWQQTFYVRWLESLASADRRVNEFLKENSRSIAKKRRTSFPSSLAGSLAELRVGARLARVGFDVELLNASKRAPQPDLKIKFGSIVCHLEVKYFDATDNMTRFSRFTENVSQLRVEVPKGWKAVLDVSIQSEPQNGWNHLIYTLEQNMSCIEAAFNRAIETSTEVNELQTIFYFAIKDYPMSVRIDKRYSAEYAFTPRVGVQPIFQLSIEQMSKRISQRIKDASRQVVANSLNIVVLCTHGSPYDKLHLQNLFDSSELNIDDVWEAVAFLGPEQTNGSVRSKVWWTRNTLRLAREFCDKVEHAFGDAIQLGIGSDSVVNMCNQKLSARDTQHF